MKMYESDRGFISKKKLMEHFLIDNLFLFVVGHKMLNKRRIFSRAIIMCITLLLCNCVNFKYFHAFRIPEV